LPNHDEPNDDPTGEAQNEVAKGEPGGGLNEALHEAPDLAPDERPGDPPADTPGVDPKRAADDDAFPSTDQLLGTFMSEASLWPVLFVMLASGGAFTAALMILASVDRNPFAAVALVLILGMTVDVVFRARRHPSYRNGALFLLLLWGAGIAFAGLAIWSGIAFAG
jgi:hypothetical protein